MIRINYRFLAVVLVCFVLVGAGVQALHYVQTRRTAHVYLERAQAAQQEENLPEALDLFRRYLQLIPNDMDALAGYGVTLAERCAELRDLKQRLQTLPAQEDEELRRSLRRAYGVLERVLRSQPDREDQMVLRRSLASVAMYMGRFKDALEQLQSPAMAAVKDWEVLEMKAVCQENTGDRLQAVKTYDEAIQLAPDQLDVYPQRTRLYHQQTTLLRSLASDQLRAYQETAKSLGGLDRPKKKDSLAETFDPRQDADCYIETMLRKNPTSARAYLLSAGYWYAMAAIDRAESDADKALALAPDTADALIFAADLKLAKAALPAPPNSKDQSQKQLQEHKRVVDQARQYAGRAVRLAPHDYRCYLRLAEIERQDGAIEKAIEWFRAGLKECPEEPRLLLPMAIFLLDLGKDKAGEAGKTIAALQAVPADRWPRPDQAGATIDYLQGRLDYLQGNWADAVARLERASAGLIAPETETLLRSAQLWLGSSYAQLAAASKQRDEKQQLVEKQLAAYRRARGSDGTGMQARLAAAQTLASIGRLGEAVEEQRIALGLPGVPAIGWLQLAAWLIQRYRSLQPSERDWEEVEKALGAAKNAGDDSPELPLRYAEMWAMRGDAAKAEKVLREALDKQRKGSAQDAARQRLNLWIVLAGVAQQEQAASEPEKRDWSRVEGIFSDAEKELGDSLPLRLARARYLLRRYGNQAAPGLLIKLAEKREGFSPRDQAQLLTSLAEALLQLGEVKEAKRLCQSAAEALLRLGDAEKQPDNRQVRLQVCLLQFDMAARENDRDAMEKLAGEIKELDARRERWPVAEAIRLRMVAQQQLKEKKDQEAKGSLEDALKHLAEARQLNPSWSRVPLLMAEIYDQLGQSSAALQHYREAIDQGERSVAAVQRAVQLLYAQPGLDAAEQAEKLIQQWGAQPNLAASDLSAVMQLAPEVALRPEALPQSLETARRAAENSKKYGDYVWLAQVLMVAAGQDSAAKQLGAVKMKLDEAEKALRRATELAPKEPATWIVLLDFLARSGRAEEAKKMIPQVEKNVPQGQLPRVLPRCHEMARDPAEAAKLYEAGLSETPGDLDLIRDAVEFYRRYGRVREAQAHLEEMIKQSEKTNEKALFWARRQLALVLSSSLEDEQRRRAHELIAENLKVDAKSVEDRRAQAVLLASDPDRAGREEAVAILEDLREENAATGDDCFLLAHLYWGDKEPAEPAAEGNDTSQPLGGEALKRWLRAKELMNSLLASRRIEPRYVAAYTTALLDHGEIADARLWIAQLEKLARNQPATLKLQAELLFATRNYDALVANLKSIPAASPEFPGQAALLLSAAASLEDFAGRLTAAGSKADADRLEKEAQSCLDRALDLAEKAGPKSDPGVLANFASGLLGTHAAKAAQLQRLNALLDGALKEQKRPFPLLLVLADLRTAEERFDEVETLYAEILRGDGDNVVALNNLAVLLALRGKRLDEAAQMMEKAIRRLGPNPTLLDSRAMVAAARGRPEEALKDLNEAIEEEPRPAPYFHRALIHLEKGQRATARADRDKARQLGLKEESLHPLERRMYRKLETSLKQE